MAVTSGWWTARSVRCRQSASRWPTTVPECQYVRSITLKQNCTTGSATSSTWRKKRGPQRTREERATI
jgi:hypothetical protein